MESTVKQRITDFIKYKRISVREFERQCGLSNGYVNSITQTVMPNKLKSISLQYPELNLGWITTGEGQMIKRENLTTHHVPKSSEKKLSDQEVYLYDIDAAANLKTLFQNTMDNIIDLIKVPDLPKCDGAVRVKGDSMYPLLKSGDIVFYKQIQDLKNEIFFGEMYLLSMNMAGDEYVVVKYVHRSDVEGCIKLVSYNQHHGPMDVSMETIRAMALVKASLRFNTIK